MEPETVDSISKSIHRRFPEVAGVKPKVRKQQIPESQKHKFNNPGKRNYLLTYKKNIKGPKGQTIPRWVRVVANPNGRIIKITTSK